MIPIHYRSFILRSGHLSAASHFGDGVAQCQHSNGSSRGEPGLLRAYNMPWVGWCWQAGKPSSSCQSPSWWRALDPPLTHSRLGVFRPRLTRPGLKWVCPHNQCSVTQPTTRKVCRQQRNKSSWRQDEIYFGWWRRLKWDRLEEMMDVWGKAFWPRCVINQSHWSRRLEWFTTSQTGKNEGSGWSFNHLCSDHPHWGDHHLT